MGGTKVDFLTENGFEKISLELPFKNKDILALPAFVNMHTHIGDTFIGEKRKNLPRDVKKLVAPPHGLKHVLLNNASNEEIINGMKKSIDLMEKTGTSLFCDFREQGLKGVNLLKTALKDAGINCIILSRPVKPKYDEKEIGLLLENSHGLGIGSLSEWNYEDLAKVAKYVHSKKKIFSIHASETKREDIDSILELEPDFLVHMVYASKKDLKKIIDRDIPIVICPRSNHFFGLKLDIKKLKEGNVTLTLGTDNAMINPPNIIDETKFLLRISKNVFTLEEILKMSTYTPRKILKQKHDIPKNLDKGFVLLDKKTLKPLTVTEKLSLKEGVKTL